MSSSVGGRGLKRTGPSPAPSESMECCTKGKECALHRGSTMSIVNRHPSITFNGILDMPPEVADYAIDQQVTGDSKKRVMQRHSTYETLNVLQRSIVCLKSNDEQEKHFAATKLEECSRLNLDQTFTQIIPLIENELKRNTNLEFNTASSTSLVNVCKNIHGKKPELGKRLVKLISQKIESKALNIPEIWAKATLDLIKALPATIVQNEIAPVILAQTNHPNESVRKETCALLRQMIEKPGVNLGDDIMATLTKLCKDRSAQVRGTMALHVLHILHHLHRFEELTSTIHEFFGDEDSYVKRCFIIAIGELFKKPDTKPFYNTILLIIRKFVKEAYVTGDVELLKEFALYLGEMAKVFGGAGVLNNDTKLWFLDAFIQLSRYGLGKHKGAGNDLPTGFLNFRANAGYNRRHSLVESLVSSGKATNSTRNSLVEQAWTVRANIAVGSPSFLKFSMPIVDFKTGLHPLITDLIHDPHYGVRAAMSRCLWPVMQLLGKSGHIMYGEFVYLLSDDFMEVVEGLVENTAEILQVFVKGKVISPETMTPGLIEVGGALIFAEERLHQANNWRLHTSFLEQVSVLPFCLPGDYIYNNLVPNLFHRLINLRQLPSRMAVADCIVTYLRHCRRANQREEIRRRIKETFANGKSVQDRMLYLYMSKRIIDLFSRKYFRDHFFEDTLGMADDNVPNVRMKMCSLMPHMKKTLGNGEDAKLSAKLDEVAIKIRNSETDRDVQMAIQSAVEEMKKIGVILSNKKYDKQDQEDEAKEREEAYIESLEPEVGRDLLPRERRRSYFKTGNPRKPTEMPSDFLITANKRPPAPAPSRASIFQAPAATKQEKSIPEKHEPPVTKQEIKTIAPIKQQPVKVKPLPKVLPNIPATSKQPVAEEKHENVPKIQEQPKVEPTLDQAAVQSEADAELNKQKGATKFNPKLFATSSTSKPAGRRRTLLPTDLVVSQRRPGAK